MRSLGAFLVALWVAALAIGGRQSGTSPAPAGARRPLLGLSLDTLKEERWHRDRDFFQERARELDADVLVQAANSDDARQIHDVEALLSRNVDVLVIVPHDGAAMAKAVRLAHEAGVPVIAYDRLIEEGSLDLYVTFDAVEIGRQQARFLLARAKPGALLRLVRIHGAKTDNNSFLIKQGQDEVLGKALAEGRVKIMHEDWAEGWKPENAKKIVNAALTRFPGQIDGVLAANDGTAGGAIQALTEEGLAGKVLVTGEDAELTACQRILRGTQAMTIFQPLKEIAGRAAEAAVRLARHRPVIARDATKTASGVVIPTIAIGVVALTRENLELVVRGGYYTREQLGL